MKVEYKNKMKTKIISIFIIIVMSITSVNAFDWNNGIIHYWTFDENTGTNALDSVNSSTNGTLGTSVSWISSGKFGSAVNFGGTSGDINSRINLTNSGGVNILNKSSNFSLCAWYNLTSAFTTYQVLLGAQNGTYWVSFGAHLPNQDYIFNSAFTVPLNTDGKRYDYICVVANSSKFDVYTNGTLVGSNLARPPFWNNSYEWIIGNDPNNAGGFKNGLHGSVDEMAIWNRKLSPTEISELWNNGNGQIFNNSLFINSPSNNSILISLQPINFNCSFNPTTINISNITLYINGVVNYTLINNTDTYEELIKNYRLPTGNYNWTCEVRLIDNYLFTANTYFFNTSIYIMNNQTYNPIAFETSIESFILNTSIDDTSYPVQNANLIYNNTVYPAIKTTTASNYLFTSTVPLPLINTPNLNNSFYWSLGLTNTTGTFYFNSSVNNQTVYQMSLGNCSGINSTLVLNISNYDQDSLIKLNSWNFKGTIDYYSSNNSLFKSVTFNDLNITDKLICTNTNRSLQINGRIEYSVNSSYQTSTYYFVNQTVSNVTTNLSFYSLLLSETTVFTIKVFDQYSLPVPNYFVNIQRYYSGLDDYFTVQSIKTDSNGQSVTFIEINNVQYRFQVLDPYGNIVYTTTPTVITPQSSPYTITINIAPLNQSQLSYNRNITGISYSLSYDKNLKIVTFGYSDSNSSFVSAELNIYNTLGNGDVSVCDNNLTNPNGVITCNLTNYTGSFKAVAYIYRDTQLYINNLFFDITNFDAGALGIFGGICILLICAFMFAFNEVAGIVAIDFGVIIVNLLHLINFGWMIICAIIGISVIMLIVLERG